MPPGGRFCNEVEGKSWRFTKEKGNVAKGGPFHRDGKSILLVVRTKGVADKVEFVKRVDKSSCKEVGKLPAKFVRHEDKDGKDNKGDAGKSGSRRDVGNFSKEKET